VIIPARGGSKGIPRKNLRKIHGKSLTEWAILSAGELRFEKKVILSSDDEDILSIAENYDFVETSQRPGLLSGDAVADFEVLRYELSQAEERFKTLFACIVMLQPTSPIRNPKTLESCVTSVLEGLNSSVWTVVRVPPKFHPRKQLRMIDEKLVMAIESPLVIGRQELDETFIRTGVCYAISRDTLLTDDKLLGVNSRPQFCTWQHSNIDDLDDLVETENSSEVVNGYLVSRSINP
jgi:CMP-N,N'-diacetyllegionaminic acid synthase